MRKKKDGLTLSEKIEKAIEKVKKKENVVHMNDTFYEEIVDEGVVFYLRKTNLQRETEGRLKNVIDKVELEEKKKTEADAKEAARDMEFDEFKEKYITHIEGTAVNERLENQDSDEDGPADGTGLKKGSQMNLSGRGSSHKNSRQEEQKSRMS